MQGSPGPLGFGLTHLAPTSCITLQQHWVAKKGHQAGGMGTLQGGFISLHDVMSFVGSRELDWSKPSVLWEFRGAAASAGRFAIQALSSPRLAQSPAMTWAVQWLSAAGLGELGCTQTLTPGCLPVPIANPAKRALCHSGLEQRMGRAKLPAKHRSASVRQRSSNSSTSSGQGQWEASCDARC